MMIAFNELKVGQHYIPVFERIEPTGAEFYERYRTDSPYYQYLGGREFENEHGETVDGFVDPELALQVAVDAPDGFIQ